MLVQRITVFSFKLNVLVMNILESFELKYLLSFLNEIFVQLTNLMFLLENIFPSPRELVFLYLRGKEWHFQRKSEITFLLLLLRT